MPLAKMGCTVTHALQNFRKSDLFFRHVSAVGIGYVHSEWVSARDDTGTGRGTYRRGRIKPVQDDSLGSQLIQMRRPNVGVPIKSGIEPSLIIGHNQNDIGTRGTFFGRTGVKSK